MLATAGHAVAGSIGRVEDAGGRPVWFDAVVRSGGDVALIVGHCGARFGLSRELREAIRQRCDAGAAPGQIAAEFHDPDAGTALLVAVFDPQTRRLSYAATGDAGPILAIGEGPVAMLLGAGDTARSTPVVRELTLPPRAVVAFSTQPPLVERVIREKCLGPRPTATQIVERLHASPVMTERGATLALTLGVDAGERFACSLPAVPFTAPYVRASLRAFAHAFGLDADRMFALQTAVGEAVANSIEHAYDQASAEFGAIRVSAERGADDVTVWVEDDGRWRLDSEPCETRGRGLPLMRALVDNVDIVSDGRSTTVRLTLRLDEPAGGAS